MAAAAKHSDALIIGGGHNGLVCAAYLAAGGLKVTVLERRAVVGGAAVTEEFHPGFRNSVAAYTVSLLNPKVIADLELPRHGLKVIERLVAADVDRQVRAWEKASDHAPTWIELRKAEGSRVQRRRRPTTASGRNRVSNPDHTN